MGSTTIVDSGANTGLDFLLRSPQLAVPPVGTRSEARVPPQGRASEAPKRHLRGGACSLMPHASVGVTRARSEPTPSREKKPVDTFIPRPSCLPMRLGKAKNVRSSSPPSRRLVSTPGQRLARVARRSSTRLALCQHWPRRRCGGSRHGSQRARASAPRARDSKFVDAAALNRRLQPHQPDGAPKPGIAVDDAPTERVAPRKPADDQVDERLVIEDDVDLPQGGIPELSPLGNSTSKTLRYAYARRTMAPPWKPSRCGHFALRSTSRTSLVTMARRLRGRQENYTFGPVPATLARCSCGRASPVLHREVARSRRRRRVNASATLPGHPSA